MRAAILALILVPLAAVLVLFAMANRALVAVSVDPFGASSAFSVQAPLFLVILLSVMAGILIGGVADWARQGRYRREARSRRWEMQRMEAERAERAEMRAQADSRNGRALALPASEA